MDTETPAKRLKTERVKGIATIKPEFRPPPDAENALGTANKADDGFEEEGRAEENGSNGKKNKKKGQNKKRNNAQKRETIRLCPRVVKSGHVNTEGGCELGEQCKYSHNIDEYIASKPADISGKCPVLEAIGYCPSGLKCRWLQSHGDAPTSNPEASGGDDMGGIGELNVLTFDTLTKIQKRQIDLSLSESVVQRMEELDKVRAAESKSELSLEERLEYNASFFEGRTSPLEKKRLNLSGAKILSPLTTVGNLPYRRLMKTLGADVTYCEMALSLPLVQGTKSEWALPRMHESELGGFGVQLAANKPWQAIKAAQLLSEFAPSSSELNLNCGCPIDLVYKQGAGSALMDSPGRAIKILKGMNATSGDLPVTIKMRTGTKDGKPTAHNFVQKLLEEQQVAAVTLHGRSRAQRYSREADWQYIKSVAEQVKSQRDEYELKPWIIGNGDVYSWEDWYTHIEEHKVDSCMVARGALVKPWIFEEIESKQYLDKSASERLRLYEQYAKFGLEHWGSDEYGVQQTRRFMCEFLSFTRRYTPVGVLEYMPPHLNDRSEPWQGRNELETLMASSNYRDWIKITEMFLGPAPESFQFEPKHKSTS